MKSLTIAVLSLTAFGTCSIVAAQTKRKAIQQPAALTVCDLLEHPKKFNGRVVTVRGQVMADLHSTAISEDSCDRAVGIRYDRESQPEAFVAGVEAKRGRIDARRFLATVTGRFQSRIRGPLGYFSRIEVTRVSECNFVQD